MKSIVELNKLYDECMEYWGLEKQSRMVQEECAELILAVSHFNRGRKYGEGDVIEELADVYLMIHQLMRYFGDEKVWEVIDFKSNLVKRKLERYKNGNKGD